MPETSASLLERLRSPADAVAWRRLDDLYRPLILAWLRRDPSLGPHAEDLAQDVMAVLVRELPAYERRRTGSFRLWLKTIAINRLRAFWRDRNRGRVVGPSVLELLADPASDLSRVWDDEHRRHVFRRLLEMLEPEFQPHTWEAFRQTVIGESPAAEVAERLGMTVGAVLQAKSRVLKRLRAEGRGLLD